MEEILVSVICITYNQEQYIRDCIEGMLMQKTDFNYEIIIHDDASTDNTASIIREYKEKYPDMIKAIYQKENQYSKGNSVVDIVAAVTCGKYIAQCEGDDYWIDEYKLKRQVEYLENHPDCAICFHNAKMLDMCTGELFEEWCWNQGGHGENIYTGGGIYSTREMLELGCAPWASYVYRKKDYPQINLSSSKIKFADMPLFAYLASKGYGYCCCETMSIYRRNVPNSITTKAVEGTKRFNEWLMVNIEMDEKFDRYFDYRYHELFQLKIENCKKGIMLFKLEDIKKLENKVHKIYIYGAGRCGKLCAADMLENRIPLEGFIISNLEEKGKSKIPIWHLNEITEKEKIGIVVAVGQKNRIEIIKELKIQGIHNYCVGCVEEYLSY